MGWNDGPVIANRVWGVVGEYIPENAQQEVAKKIIRIFDEFDADDWSVDLYQVAYGGSND